jgi:hypothetical protein
MAFWALALSEAATAIAPKNKCFSMLKKVLVIIFAVFLAKIQEKGRRKHSFHWLFQKNHYLCMNFRQ